MIVLFAEVKILILGKTKDWIIIIDNTPALNNPLNLLVLVIDALQIVVDGLFSGI